MISMDHKLTLAENAWTSSGTCQGGVSRCEIMVKVLHRKKVKSCCSQDRFYKCAVQDGATRSSGSDPKQDIPVRLRNPKYYKPKWATLQNAFINISPPRCCLSQKANALLRSLHLKRLLNFPNHIINQLEF